MTRQRFLAKQQCVENVIVVDALDVTRNRAVSLECTCSAEIVYCGGVFLNQGGDTHTGTDLHQPLKFATFVNPRETNSGYATG